MCKIIILFILSVGVRDVLKSTDYISLEVIRRVKKAVIFHFALYYHKALVIHDDNEGC
jgi:hypothetical protein